MYWHTLYSDGNLIIGGTFLGIAAILLLLGRIKIPINSSSLLMEKWKGERKKVQEPYRDPVGMCDYVQTVYGLAKLSRALDLFEKKCYQVWHSDSALVRWTARATMVLLVLFLVGGAIWLLTPKTLEIIAAGGNAGTVVAFWGKEAIILVMISVVMVLLLGVMIGLSKMHLCPQIIVREPEG